MVAVRLSPRNHYEKAVRGLSPVLGLINVSSGGEEKSCELSSCHFSVPPLPRLVLFSGPEGQERKKKIEAAASVAARLFG